MMLFAAAAAMTFNLLCEGTEYRSRPYAAMFPKADRTPSSSRPFREVYPVNLAEKRWCSGSCIETKSLVPVSPALIIMGISQRDLIGTHQSAAKLENIQANSTLQPET